MTVLSTVSPNTQINPDLMQKQGKDGNILASCFVSHPGYCCGEWRLGHLSYQKTIYNPQTGMYKDYSEQEVLEGIRELLIAIEQKYDAPFYRCNLNKSYPLWHRVLKEAGFVVVYEWQNRSGGNFMIEYVKAKIPGEKFKKENKVG